MKYYKQLNKNNEVVALLTYDFEPNITDSLMIRITAEEYENIDEEWRANAKIEISPKVVGRRVREMEKFLKAKAYDAVSEQTNEI